MCSVAVETADLPYGGMMWFSYSKMVTAITGAFHIATAPAATGSVTTVYNNDIMMVALNQLSSGVCDKAKTVVDPKATP